MKRKIKQSNVIVMKNILMIIFILVAGGITKIKAQQSYTFTPCGATGQYGPNSGQVASAYATTNLNGLVTVVGQGVQQWTVPASGFYSIKASGAGGKSTSINCSNTGGYGAEIYGEFNLTAGQVLLILVGQEGLNAVSGSSQDGGGGGGSYVTTSSSVALIVAGGGGGATNNIQNCTGTQRDGLNASLTTAGTAGANGSGAGGVNGNGGTGTGGGAGGGFITDGTGGSTSGGKAFLNGGAGGIYGGAGGFGGGGGGFSIGGNGGGGGGYSGGGTNSSSPYSGGGGGGSFNSGANQASALRTSLGDGNVVITRLCNVSVSASNNPVCIGSNVVLSTNAIGPISWSNNSATTSSILVSPTVNTTYTVTGTGTGTNVCVGSAVIQVTITPLPTISTMVNPQLLCVGGLATLTAAGANTYTWSNSVSGNTVTANPSTSASYTVIGTDIFGCINSATIGVAVNSNVITISSNTSICQGSSYNIVAGGAVNYTWNTGWPFSILPVTPSVSTVYSVIGIDANNCVLTNSVAVNVNPAPNVFASSDKDVICKGESVTLNGTGASTYVWNNPTGGSGNGSSLTLNLNIDIPYTFSVTGTGANGCTGTATVLVMVEKCSGINEAVEKNLSLSVYPNPTSGLFTIKSEKVTSGTIEIIDFTGKIIYTETIKGNSTDVNMSDYAAGVYFVKVKNETSSEVIKLVKD